MMADARTGHGRYLIIIARDRRTCLADWPSSTARRGGRNHFDRRRGQAWTGGATDPTVAPYRTVIHSDSESRVFW
jgi:hypothetical protein